MADHSLESDRVAFGEILRVERQLRDLTQAEAASLTGITLRQWVSIEKGGRSRAPTRSAILHTFKEAKTVHNYPTRVDEIRREYAVLLGESIYERLHAVK